MESFLQASLAIFIAVSLLWGISVLLTNVSIIDIFWGCGFVIVSGIYFINLDAVNTRNWLILVLVSVWGLRLSIHLFIRNRGKGEDFRYSEFRREYGPKRYWWISYFQTFLLQGTLMMLISITLFGAYTGTSGKHLNAFDYLGIFIWCIGFLFEAGGDLQLVRFKKNPINKGKVLNTGFWKYTRHPNYFGDAAIWWAFALFSMAGGNYWHMAGALILTLLLVKVSGVSLLEKTLKETKPQYKKYMETTNAFFPWFPKKD